MSTELDSLTAILNRNPKYLIAVHKYSDSRLSSHSLNQARLDQIVAYLRKRLHNPDVVVPIRNMRKEANRNKPSQMNQYLLFEVIRKDE